MKKRIIFGLILIVFVWFGGSFLFSNFVYNLGDFRKSVREKFDGTVSVENPVIPQGECLITDFGATAMSGKIYTESIQSAIDTCFERGGGTVRVPAGTWLTGPLEMKSKIRLFLDRDARLVFSADKELYRKGVSNRFEGIEMIGLTPLLWAQNCQNVEIDGEGVIDGSGDVWQLDESRRGQERALFDSLSQAVEQDVPAYERVFVSGDLVARSDLVLLNKCDRVAIHGVSFVNSPRWTLHFLYSDNIFIHDAEVKTDGPNTDGIIIDSSKNVRIENMNIQSGDDAIVMKSGLDADGRRIGVPTENVAIRDARIDGAHGGIVVGSEMSGGIQNIFAERCFIKNAWVAGRIKAPKGRGGFVRNIVMRDISYESISRNVVHIDMAYEYNVSEEQDGESKNFPDVQGIFLSNFHGTDAQRLIDIDGVTQKPIRNVVMTAMDMQGGKGIALQNVSKVAILDSKFDVRLGNIKDKVLFSLENADGVIVENLDCNDTMEKKCVNVSKNQGKRSLFLAKSNQASFFQKGNVVVANYFIPPFHSWGMRSN